MQNHGGGRELAAEEKFEVALEGGGGSLRVKAAHVEAVEAGAGLLPWGICNASVEGNVAAVEAWLEGGGHTPLELGFRAVHAPDSAHFKKRIADVNKRLAQVGDSSPLSLETMVALRMHTGEAARRVPPHSHLMHQIHWMCPRDMECLTLTCLTLTCLTLTCITLT